MLALNKISLLLLEFKNYYHEKSNHNPHPRYSHGETTIELSVSFSIKKKLQVVKEL